MQTYIGIDFGGTKMLIGELTSKGEILNYKSYPTFCKNEEQALHVITTSLNDYINTVGFNGTPVSAGIGIVGLVDFKRGEWIGMNQELPEKPVPIAKIVSEILDIPVRVDNDVRSAATAELILGYGKEYRDFIYLNVGTGLAAGFVVDGNIIRGANNNAGEIGHTVVDYTDKTICECGRSGCAENIVSGYGFTKQISEILQLSELLDKDTGRADVAEIFHRADLGDELCKGVLNKATITLANVIMNLIRFTDPALIILGGGIVSDGRMLERIKPYLSEITMRGVTGGIVLSGLSPRFTGLIGAAAVGMTIKI